MRDLDAPTAPSPYRTATGPGQPNARDGLGWRDLPPAPGPLRWAARAAAVAAAWLAAAWL